MNNELFEEIDKKVKKILDKYKNIIIEYETEGDEWERINDIDYIIVIENSKTALQTLVRIRNEIYNNDELFINEFIEEQVGDQMADDEEYFVVDFYIGLNR